MTITRLTSGPKHHFFGYYGIRALNRSQRYHLALETDFHERAPEKGDNAQIGLVDMETRAFTPYAETSAFNLQQGSMMHWIDVGFGEEFTYNDWEDGQLVSRAINPETKNMRTIHGAIASVSPTEPIALGLNFARMRVCRRVVGYANDYYQAETAGPIPEDDGLFLLDLKTGESRLLLSIAEVARALPVKNTESLLHWFNHVIFNTDGTRLLFFCRIQQPGRFLDSLWTVNRDGSELECQIDYDNYVSHVAWLDPEQFMISTNITGKKEFVMFTDRQKTFVPYGEGQFPDDGHNAYSPDFKWIVCDTYPRKPERKAKLMLYNIQDRTMKMLGGFYHPEEIKGDWRCDLHPRWSPDGTIVSFDSIHEGSRQIYLADVSDIVSTQG